MRFAENTKIQEIKRWLTLSKKKPQKKHLNSEESADLLSHHFLVSSAKLATTPKVLLLIALGSSI